MACVQLSLPPQVGNNLLQQQGPTKTAHITIATCSLACPLPQTTDSMGPGARGTELGTQPVLHKHWLELCQWDGEYLFSEPFSQKMSIFQRLQKRFGLDDTALLDLSESVISVVCHFVSDSCNCLFLPNKRRKSAIFHQEAKALSFQDALTTVKKPSFSRTRNAFQ